MKAFIQILIMMLFFLFSYLGTSQKSPVRLSEKHAKNSFAPPNRQNVRIVFYNTENLYDPHKDSIKSDGEFTPTGARKWSYPKFTLKLNNLAKTLLAIGEGDAPDIICLCEIENRYVLNCLIRETPLRRFNYRVVHYDSPDLRGVDAAMIYRPDRFRVVCSRPLRVIFPFDTNIRTRDILYVKGVLENGDSLHLYVNHWPSRRGGSGISSPRRCIAAAALKKHVDSVIACTPLPGIIIMGDFNDEPSDKSLAVILGAGATGTGSEPGKLYNLMYRKLNATGIGTIKYQGKWSVFDQFIVSGGLLKHGKGYRTGEQDAHIFRGKFLLQDDDRYMGEKLFRTYQGPAYKGGFSDHLPVYIDLRKNR